MTGALFEEREREHLLVEMYALYGLNCDPPTTNLYVEALTPNATVSGIGLIRG